MATCRDIITYAMRQAKVLPSGGSPRAKEMADGIVALQSLYDGWVATGMFGRLTDRYESADYTAEEGQRIIAPAGVTITVPETIDSDPTSDERAPRDLSVIETLIDGTRTVWLWDRAGWVSLLDLDENDDAPLASRGAWGLAATLAVSGAFITMFGGELTDDIRMAALRFQNGVAAKFGSTQTPIASEYY
jgi:hypothetical protein